MNNIPALHEILRENRRALSSAQTLQQGCMGTCKGALVSTEQNGEAETSKDFQCR
jgi:hypothetical protein